jgi:hypothetical protein
MVHAGEKRLILGTPATSTLHGCTCQQVVHDETTDTLCLLGWGGGRVVLAFRGTASLQVPAA